MTPPNPEFEKALQAYANAVAMKAMGDSSFDVAGARATILSLHPAATKRAEEADSKAIYDELVRVGGELAVIRMDANGTDPMMLVVARGKTRDALDEWCRDEQSDEPSSLARLSAALETILDKFRDRKGEPAEYHAFNLAAVTVGDYRNAVAALNQAREGGKGPR